MGNRPLGFFCGRGGLLMFELLRAAVDRLGWDVLDVGANPPGVSL
jgi:hypothetical protein